MKKSDLKDSDFIVIKCGRTKKIYRVDDTLRIRNIKDYYDWMPIHDYGEIGEDSNILAVIRPQNRVDEVCVGGELLFHQEGYTWTQLKPIKMTMDEICIALGHRVEIKQDKRKR